MRKFIEQPERLPDSALSDAVHVGLSTDPAAREKIIAPQAQDRTKIIAPQARGLKTTEP